MAAKAFLHLSILRVTVLLVTVCCAALRAPMRVPVPFLYGMKDYRPFLASSAARYESPGFVSSLKDVAAKMDYEFNEVRNDLPDAWRNSLSRKESITSLKANEDAVWYIIQLYCAVHETIYCSIYFDPEKSLLLQKTERCLAFLQREISGIPHSLFDDVKSCPGYTYHALRLFNDEPYRDRMPGGPDDTEGLASWDAPRSIDALAPIRVCEYIVRSGILFGFLVSITVPPPVPNAIPLYKEIGDMLRLGADLGVYANKERVFMDKMKTWLDSNVRSYIGPTGGKDPKKRMKEFVGEIIKYLDSYAFYLKERMERPEASGTGGRGTATTMGSDYESD